LIKIWSFESKLCLKTLAGHLAAVRCFTSVNNNLLVSGSSDKTIKLWNLSRGKCVQTFIGHSSSVIVVEIFSKEKLISGSADGFIKIWDLLGNCIHTFSKSSHCIRSIFVFSSDKILFSTDSGDINLWCLVDNHIIKTFNGHKQSSLIQKLSNETFISCSIDKTIRSWDLVTGFSKVLFSNSFPIVTFELI